MISHHHIIQMMTIGLRPYRAYRAKRGLYRYPEPTIMCSILRAMMADPIVGNYVRDKLVEQLPDLWKECAHDYDDLSRRVDSTHAETVRAGQGDFEGLWFWGAKDGSVSRGLECSGIGNVRLCVPCSCNEQSNLPHEFFPEVFLSVVISMISMQRLTIMKG